MKNLIFLIVASGFTLSGVLSGLVRHSGLDNLSQKSVRILA